MNDIFDEVFNFMDKEVLKELKNNNIVVDTLTSGIITGITIDVKGDTNYIMNVVATTVGLISSYKVSYVTYKFTSKLDEFQKIYDELDKNKVIITACLDCRSLSYYTQEENFYKSRKLVNKVIII